MARNVRIILGFAAALLCFSCGNNESSPSGSGTTTSIWNVTLGKASHQIIFSEQKATPRGDGGLTLSANASLNGETVVMTLDIGGGIPVVVPATVQIGSSGINFRMEIGTTVYRGTSGSIAFTAYDTALGQTITATFDSKFVAIGITPAVAGTLKGDFSATVTALSSSP